MDNLLNILNYRNKLKVLVLICRLKRLLLVLQHLFIYIVIHAHSSGKINNFKKNPTIHVQRDQPLIEHVTITDEHIRAQEEKVNELRRRVQQKMRSNNNSANVKMEA